MRPGSMLTADVVRARGHADDRVPVTVLTGFLGAGKTTLLNRVLSGQSGKRVLVVVNEFGDIGLDHALMAHAHEDGIIELAGGCVCCALNGDLARTLADAVWRFSKVGKRAFDRVVIETTGLATPAGVTSVLHRDFRVAAHYVLGGVVTVIDAVNAVEAAAGHDEVLGQLRAADRVVLTKRDLIDTRRERAVRRWVRSTNPLAEIVDAAAADVLSLSLSDWRFAATGRSSPIHPSDSVPTVSATLAGEIDESALAPWLDLVVAAGGSSLLRVKGIVQTVHGGAPLAIHAVQGVAYPAVRLDVDVPSQSSQIVFIGAALTSPSVASLIDAAQVLFPGCRIERRNTTEPNSTDSVVDAKEITDVR